MHEPFTRWATWEAARARALAPHLLLASSLSIHPDSPFFVLWLLALSTPQPNTPPLILTADITSLSPEDRLPTCHSPFPFSMEQ